MNRLFFLKGKNYTRKFLKLYAFGTNESEDKRKDIETEENLNLKND